MISYAVRIDPHNDTMVAVYFKGDNQKVSHRSPYKAKRNTGMLISRIACASHISRGGPYGRTSSVDNKIFAHNQHLWATITAYPTLPCKLSGNALAPAPTSGNVDDVARVGGTQMGGCKAKNAPRYSASRQDPALPGVNDRSK